MLKLTVGKRSGNMSSRGPDGGPGCRQRNLRPRGCVKQQAGGTGTAAVGKGWISFRHPPPPSPPPAPAGRENGCDRGKVFEVASWPGRVHSATQRSTGENRRRHQQRRRQRVLCFGRPRSSASVRRRRNRDARSKTPFVFAPAGLCAPARARPAHCLVGKGIVGRRI